MHFDPRLDIVPTRDMTKSFHRDSARELAINPMQKIKVKCCRYALGIIIGGEENICVFDAIDADEQHRVGAQGRRHRSQ